MVQAAIGHHPRTGAFLGGVQSVRHGRAVEREVGAILHRSGRDIFGLVFPIGDSAGPAAAPASDAQQRVAPLVTPLDQARFGNDRRYKTGVWEAIEPSARSATGAIGLLFAPLASTPAACDDGDWGGGAVTAERGPPDRPRMSARSLQRECGAPAASPRLSRRHGQKKAAPKDRPDCASMVANALEVVAILLVADEAELRDVRPLDDREDLVDLLVLCRRVGLEV